MKIHTDPALDRRLAVAAALDCTSAKGYVDELLRRHLPPVDLLDLIVKVREEKPQQPEGGDGA